MKKNEELKMKNEETNLFCPANLAKFFLILHSSFFILHLP